MSDILSLIPYALSLLMLLVFYFDATRYIIPNTLNIAILALYPLFVLLSPEAVDWPAALLALGIVFALGFVLFALKVTGAGDIKLLCACSLWCGFGLPLVEFLIYMGLLGGALALGVALARQFLPGLLAAYRPETAIPRLLTHGEPLPYGLAIAAAFLIVLWDGTLPGLPR